MGIALFLGAQRLYQYAQGLEVFRIQTVEIEGEAPLLKEDVLLASGIRPSTNIFNLDIEKTRMKLVDHARIHSASVAKVLPNTVRINVSPEVPVAMVNVDGLSYINSEGEIYDRVAPGANLKLPLIQLENSTGGDKVAARLKLALQIIDWSKRSSTIKPESLGDIWLRGEGYDGMAPVEMTLDFTSNAKQKYLDKRLVSITFSEIDLPKQLQRLEAVLKELDERGRIPTKIRMEFEKKVVVKIAQ